MAAADLKKQFDAAAEAVKTVEERPDNDTMLRLYSLYKQATEGDVKGDKPGFFDFVGTASTRPGRSSRAPAPTRR